MDHWSIWTTLVDWSIKTLNGQNFGLYFHNVIGKMLLNCPEIGQGWKKALHTFVAKLTFTLSWLEGQLYYSKIKIRGPYLVHILVNGPHLVHIMTLK